MEYEKKFKDALERAKSFIKRGGEYDRLVMESIFPELKESEDERIRKIIIGQMELWHECALENNAVQDIKDSADAISYLEKQKEQKPAEWSDEDEKMLQRIIGHLTSFIYTNSLYGDDAKECIDWLKSHSPQLHWKPSEEQIVALARATNRCVGVDDAKILIKLLEQLEKL